MVSEKRENSIVVTPVANSKVSLKDVEQNIEMIGAAGIVLTQLEIPTETVEYADPVPLHGPHFSGQPSSLLKSSRLPRFVIERVSRRIRIGYDPGRYGLPALKYQAHRLACLQAHVLNTAQGERRVDGP